MMMVDEIKESVVVVVVQGGGKDEGKRERNMASWWQMWQKNDRDARSLRASAGRR